MAIFPEQGEGLREAAFRNAFSNGFRDTHAIAKLLDRSDLSCLSEFGKAHWTDGISNFIDLFGINPEGNVTASSNQREYRSRDWISFFGAYVRRGHISTVRRVSPRALKERSVIKAIWALKPISFDPATRELLLDKCPACAKPLCWRFTFGPAYCGRCCVFDDRSKGRVDLRAFPQQLIAVTDERALDFVTDLIDPENSSRRLLHEIPKDLREFERGELFQFAVQLAGACRRSNGWDDSPENNVQAIQMAGRAILRWPDQTLELLQSFVSRSASTRPSAWLQARPTQALLNDPSLNNSLRKKLRMVAENQARKETYWFRVASDFQKSRGHCGLIERNPADPTRRIESTSLISRRHADDSFFVRSEQEASILLAGKLLRETPGAREVAKLLGIPVPQLLGLYEEGLLPELDGVLRAIWHRKEQSAALSGLWSDQITNNPSSSPSMPLARAVSAIAQSTEPPWAMIFLAILDGSLRVWRNPRNGAGLTQQLETDDFEALRTLVHSLAMRRRESRQVLTQNEAALTFGKGADLVPSLRSLIGDRVPLTPYVIDAARSQWIFSFEVRDLTTMGLLEDLGSMRSLRAMPFTRRKVGNFTVWLRQELQQYRVVRDKLEPSKGCSDD